MKDFEYAAPTTESAALELLSPRHGRTEVLAGGTDLVGLLRQMIVTPDRVVNIMEVPSLRLDGQEHTDRRLFLSRVISAPESG